MLSLAAPTDQFPLMFPSVHITQIIISLYSSTWINYDLARGEHRALRKDRRKQSKEEGTDEENQRN
jgi:hypothetical protein